MHVAHFYHCYAAGEWRAPLAEHLSALARTAFTAPVHVGLVGSPEQRRTVRELLEAEIPGVRIAAQADDGFEQVTLDPLREHAIANPDGAVLYAHSKGAGFPAGWEDRWRRSMTCALFAALEENVAALEHVDAVGSHWLTPEEFPNGFDVPVFGGNFWLARCSHLLTLPVCSRENRHEAEAWIGRGPGRPRVLDLQPGWPGVANCVTRIGWPR